MREQEHFIPIEQIGTQDDPVMIPGTGVILGKFYPPHKGHKFLIDSALQGCTALTVVVVEKSGEEIPGSLRQKWVQEIHPYIVVKRLNADGYPSINSKIWAELTINKLNFVPEKAFSSEDYGEPWSEAMGNTHVLVDIQREEVPVSGTMIRENPVAFLHYLEPNVAAYFTKGDIDE